MLQALQEVHSNNERVRNVGTLSAESVSRRSNALRATGTTTSVLSLGSECACSYCATYTDRRTLVNSLHDPFISVPAGIAGAAGGSDDKHKHTHHVMVRLEIDTDIFLLIGRSATRVVLRTCCSTALYQRCPPSTHRAERSRQSCIRGSVEGRVLSLARYV